MVQRLLTCLFFLSLSLGLNAQIPPACFPPNSPPADDCDDACIYCNFNGILSQTTGYAPGGVPFFCGSIENDQWLGFIAGCTSATFSVTPSNCTDGNGCQIALYGGCGENFIACNGGCSGCGTTQQNITVNNMLVGTNYYLLIDGWAGDNCNFQISVTPANCVSAPQVGPTGAMTGPTTMCPNGHGTYCVPPVTGAGGYLWTIPADAEINGEPGPGPIALDAPDGRCVTITFGPSTGPKQVCVKPANSCFQGTQICKTVNVQPLVPTQLPPAIVCFEQADLYNLPWGDPINTTPGTQNYQTTITTATGCDSVVKKTVTVKPPLLTTLPPKVICQGDCVTVGGQQFCDSGNQSVTVNTYQGCDSTINFNLTVLEPIADIIGGGTITCTNQSITLNSAPPVSGAPVKVWKKIPGNTTVGTGASVTITSPGTYVLTVTLTQGGVQCTKADTVTIQGNNTAPTLGVTGGIIGCAATTATLNATTNAPPTPTWNWTGPGGFTSTVQSPVVSQQGTYNVTVTNSTNGCTATTTATVTGNTTPPSVTTQGSTLTCTVNSTTVSATSSANPSGYLWSGPGGFSSTLASPTVTSPGTYNLTVTDTGNGCTSTANAVVNLDNAQPNAGASASGNIGCNNPTITLNGSSTTPNVSYAWTGPNGFSSAAQNPSASDIGTYTVTVTGTNGCTNTAPVTVNGSLAAPNASATGGTITCTATQIQLNGGSPTPNVTYSWSGPGGFSSTLEDPFVTAPGNYSLVVTNPINGCTSTASANVPTDLAAPTASATGGVIDCVAGAVTLNGSTGTAGATIEWSGPGGFTSTQNNPTVTQQGTYTLTATGTNGCTNTADAIVTLDAGVPVSFANGGELNCTNTTVTVTGGTSTPGATFSWTLPDGSTSTSGSFLVGTPGDYVLTAVAANGCKSVATAFVTQDIAQPGAQAQGGQVTCTTPSFQISSTSPTNPVTYSWSGPSTFSSTDQNPIVTDPGNYIVTITGPNGCTSTATAILTADVNTPVAVGTGGTLTCSAVAITLQGSVNINGSSFQWMGPNSFTTISQNPVVSEPGNYTLNVTSPNGCTDATTVDVLQNITQPGAVAVGNTISCKNPSVTINGNSQTAGVTFAWTGPNSFSSTNPDPTVSVTGDYHLVTTDPVNGCTSETIAVVDADKALPDFSITGGELTCANPSINLGSVVDSTAATLSWSGPGAFASTLPDPAVTVKGDYKLVVTGKNGCTDERTVTVTEDKVAPNATATGGTLTCLITQIPLDGGSTTPNATYAWTGPNNYTSNLSDPLIDVAGTYQLVVTGPNGCTNTASATVNLNGAFPPLTTAVSNVLDCNAPKATITATSTVNGVTYQWAGPNNFESFDQKPEVTVSGTYTVTITDPGNGCTSKEDQVVTEDFLKPQNVLADGGTIDCISGSYQLKGSTTSTGVTYAWSGPNGYASTAQNPTVTNDGEYTLVVKLPNGCTDSDTAYIFKNTLSPDVSVVSPGLILDCNTPTQSVTGSTTTANTTTGWTGPNGFTATTGNITVSAPGAYLFTVTSTVNGCVTSESITFTANFNKPQNITVTGATLTCAAPGANIEASTTTPTVGYLWDGPPGFAGAASKKVFVTIPGTYTVYIQVLVNGCVDSAKVTVLSDKVPPANVAAIGATATCKDPNPEISVSSTTSNVTFVWTNDQGLGWTDAGDLISSDGEGEYYVVATNPVNGCTAADTVVVDANKLAPTVTTSVSNIITCTVPTATISATPATGVKYKWSGPNGFTSTLQSPSVTATGTYTVTVTRDDNGCTAKKTIVVLSDGSIPVVQVSGTVITCKDPASQLVASTDKQVKWKWNGPGIVAPKDTIPNPSVTVPGTYTVIATDVKSGCTGVATFPVTTDTQSPTVSIAQPGQFTCSDTIITVSATASPAGVSFDWTTADGNIISAPTAQQIQVDAVGDYVLLVTNPNNGCTATKSTTVTANSAVPSGLVFDDHDVRCFGETNGYSTIASVTGGTPPYQYSFEGGPYGSTTTFTNLPAGVYQVGVLDALGCKYSTTFDIAEPPQIVVDLGPDTLIRLGDSLLIDFSNVVNIPNSQIQQMAWSGSFIGCDTCPAFWMKPLNSQVLSLTVIDTLGCRALDVRFIEVDKQRHIYVPSAFAPDSDDNNLFYIFGGQDVLEIEQFQVFDRWGERVHNYTHFAPNDPTSGWDGTFRNNKADPAVFVWWARIKFIDNVVKTYKGSVTLTR